MKRVTVSKKATKIKDELIKEIKEKTGNLCVGGNIICDVVTFKSTCVLGNCQYCRHLELFRIGINEDLLNKGTMKQIKETLIHEIIHTLPYCWNHRQPFKTMTDYYKRLTGYDALSDDCKGILKRPTRNITYVCAECGEEYHRARRSLNHHLCGKCLGRLELKET